MKIWIGQLRRAQSQELLRSDHPTVPARVGLTGLESSEAWGEGATLLTGFQVEDSRDQDSYKWELGADIHRNLFLQG